MRAVRLIGLAAAVIVGLGIVAILALRLFFDPNDYKGRVQSAFRDATGRDLRLEGALELSVFPWLAVETGAAEVGNREGFGSDPFVSLQHARIGIRLWPLITARRIEMGRVRVDGLRLNLQVARNGRDNWQDLLDRLNGTPKGSESGQLQGKTPGQGSVGLDIAGVELRDARLSLDDREADSSYAIERWNLETSRLQRGLPFDIRTSLSVARKGEPLGTFDLRTRVDLTQPGHVTLTANEGTLAIAGLGSGSAPVSIELHCPEIAFDSTTRDIEVQALEGRLADAKLTTSLQVRQGRGGPVVRGPVEFKDSRPRKLLESLGMRPPQTRDGKVLSLVAATSQLAYSSRQGLQLTSLDLRIDDTHLTGSLAAPDLARRSLRFKLSADALDVDRYLPPAAATDKPASRATPPAAGAAKFAALRKLDLQGTLSLRKLVVAAIPFQDVRLGVEASDGRLSASPFEARAFGGRTSTRLMLDVRRDVPGLRLEQELHDVDVGQLLGQLVQVRALQGRGQASFTIESSGADLPTLIRNAQGPFDLDVENGTIVGVDLWFEIERAVAAAQKNPAALSARSSGRTEFQSMRGHGTIGNRTLHNDRMEFVSDFAHVTGRGDVDYGANRLDLALTAKLLKAPDGRVFGVKLSRVEGADIPLKVTGHIDKPKVQPDVSALLGAAAKSTLTQPLEGKAKKALEKLFKF